MRPALLCLLLLSMATPARAAFIMYGGSGGCTTPVAGDVFNDGFLGVGYETSGWTETVGTGGTVNEDATLSGSPPAGACTEGLLTSVTTSGSATYTTKDLGQALARGSNIDVKAYFRVNSVTLPAQYDAFTVLNFDNDTIASDTGSAFIRLHNETGSDLRIFAAGATNSTKVAINTGTWYMLTLRLAATAASSYLQIDAGTQYTFTRADTADCRYLRLGMSQLLDADEAGAIEWGVVWLDTP